MNKSDEGYGPSASHLELEDVEDWEFEDDTSLCDLNINCGTPTSIDSGRPLNFGYASPTNNANLEKLGTYTVIQKGGSAASSLLSTPSTILKSAFDRVDHLDQELKTERLQAKIKRLEEELAYLEGMEGSQA